jgi:hypothetical protein
MSYFFPKSDYPMTVTRNEAHIYMGNAYSKYEWGKEEVKVIIGCITVTPGSESVFTLHRNSNVGLPSDIYEFVLKDDYRPRFLYEFSEKCDVACSLVSQNPPYGSCDLSSPPSHAAPSTKRASLQPLYL